MWTFAAAGSSKADSAVAEGPIACAAVVGASGSVAVASEDAAAGPIGRLALCEETVVLLSDSASDTPADAFPYAFALRVGGAIQTFAVHLAAYRSPAERLLCAACGSVPAAVGAGVAAAVA